MSASKSAQFRTHPAPRRRYDLPGTACLVSSADRCSVSSVRGRVSCLAWSALVLARPALLPVRCSLSGCAGAGVSTGGVYSRRPAPPGQSFNHRKNKKGSKITPPPIVNLKNFPQKQKDPYKGSAFCAILALQALKGRNLQRCTPYLE